jgi:hypothetical protein
MLRGPARRLELRAELSGALLAGELGISSDVPQRASYVDSWLDALKKDKRRFSGLRLTLRRLSICSGFILTSGHSANPSVLP